MAGRPSTDSASEVDRTTEAENEDHFASPVEAVITSPTARHLRVASSFDHHADTADNSTNTALVEEQIETENLVRRAMLIITPRVAQQELQRVFVGETIFLPEIHSQVVVGSRELGGFVHRRLSMLEDR